MSKMYLINPDRKVPWNDLPLLPIQEELYRTVEVLEKLGDAKAALSRLLGRSVVIPDQGLLINTISLQEAKLSSAIENIFTTDDELYKAYSDQNFETNSPSKEVLRYREALWSGYSYLKAKDQFDEAYFIHVFQEIKQTSDGIRPEFINTTIKQGGSEIHSGEIIYTPPRGERIIREKLSNLIDFINDDNQYKIDPLLKMAIAHYQFEAIHPFRDGNGRTGRIFCIHFLTQKGLLEVPILFLSRYILNNKDEYYAGLQGISRRGDWKNWLLFMLSAVESTSIITYNKINEIVSAKEAILNYLRKGKNKFRTLDDLVQFIFTQPFIKVSHLVSAGMYAENTGRNYLNKLCEMQVLEKKEIEGRHYYLNLELYRILSE